MDQLLKEEKMTVDLKQICEWLGGAFGCGCCSSHDHSEVDADLVNDFLELAESPARAVNCPKKTGRKKCPDCQGLGMKLAENS